MKKSRIFEILFGQARRKRIERLVQALEGPNLSEAMAATYELRGDEPERVISALRNNLARENRDLLEITAMRLGVRFKDAASFNKLVELAQSHQDDLVFSAALAGFTTIAERHSHFLPDALKALRGLYAKSLTVCERTKVARGYLSLIGKIASKDYAPLDSKAVIAQYEAATSSSTGPRFEGEKTG